MTVLDADGYLEEPVKQLYRTPSTSWTREDLEPDIIHKYGSPSETCAEGGHHLIHGDVELLCQRKISRRRENVEGV